jgi:hypothetical protein
MSDGRVGKDTAADMHATEERQMGKFELTGRLLELAERRAQILELYASSRNGVGPTCEASSVSDCIATR